MQELIKNALPQENIMNQAIVEATLGRLFKPLTSVTTLS